MSAAAPGRAKEHTPEEWERIKRRFCDLYHKQRKTLAEVRQTLKDEDDFDATYVIVTHHLVLHPLIIATSTWVAVRPSFPILPYVNYPHNPLSMYYPPDNIIYTYE